MRKLHLGHIYTESRGMIITWFLDSLDARTCRAIWNSLFTLRQDKYWQDDNDTAKLFDLVNSYMAKNHPDY